MFLKEDFLDDDSKEIASSMTRPVAHTLGIDDDIESLTLNGIKANGAAEKSEAKSSNLSKVSSPSMMNSSRSFIPAFEPHDVIDITSTAEIDDTVTRNKVLDQQRDLLRRKEENRNIGGPIRSTGARKFSDTEPETTRYPRREEDNYDRCVPAVRRVPVYRDEGYDRPARRGDSRGNPPEDPYDRAEGGRRGEPAPFARRYDEHDDEWNRRRPPPVRDYPREGRDRREGRGGRRGGRGEEEEREYPPGRREYDDRRDRYRGGGPIGRDRSDEERERDRDRDRERCRSPPGKAGASVPSVRSPSGKYSDDEEYDPRSTRRGPPPEYRHEDREYENERKEWKDRPRDKRRNETNSSNLNGRERYDSGGEYEEKGRDRRGEGGGISRKTSDVKGVDKRDSDISETDNFYAVHKQQNSMVDIDRTNSGASIYRENTIEGSEHTPTPPPRPKIDLTDMRSFLTKPLPKAYEILHCYIERNASRSNKLFPEYCMYMKDGDRFLLTSKKRSYNRTSNYLISLQRGDLSRTSSNYLGKLRSNFLGTEFIVYDNGVNPKEFTDKNMDNTLNQSKVRQELGIALYASNVLGTRGPRKMKVCIPRVREDNSRVIWRPMNKEDEMLAKCKEENHTNLTYLINKPPRWNENVCAYVLNFNGRVTMASVKNFQLVTPDDQDTVVLQFGRVGKDLFTMDFRYPLSAFQAFAIGLSSFDSKLACE